ncbi:MAG: tyrosine-type recombinase/integrase [Saprospiraceae bacterium]|nr:tyrosine-type recombinase/integrase [Saprospiraceae bacterium]
MDKPVGLHGLRHSIATHLLHQGMKLTDIARFLGHATLEHRSIPISKPYQQRQ